MKNGVGECKVKKIMLREEFEPVFTGKYAPKSLP